MKVFNVVWTIVHSLKLESKKAPLYGLDGDIVSEVELPKVFSLFVRKDVIRRAFHSAFTGRLQPKGRDPLAGKRTSARSWGVGRGLARVPRVPTGRAAFISFARGGHAAFPPTTMERIWEDINRKEMARAIASALAATSVVELVRERGHEFSLNTLPVVVVDEVEEKISKTSEAREFLEKLGLWIDVVRAQRGIKIRSGRGKMRGRRYVEPKSLLFILNNSKSSFGNAVRNLPGVDVVAPSNLSVIHLAPGGVPGRLTVLSYGALKALGDKYRVVSIYE